jgi:polyisoprenoid-binding protein YceI
MSDLTTVTTRTVDHRLVPPSGTFELDPVHTFIGFRTPHFLVGHVRGSFERFAGTIEVAEDVLDSSVQVTIDASSITTNFPLRDEDLRSSTFLDVERFPSITFASTSILELAESEWVIRGDLGIHGVTRPTDLLVAFGGGIADPFGNLRVGFHATTTISRFEYGLTHDLEYHVGGVQIARDITIEIDAEAVRPLA